MSIRIMMAACLLLAVGCTKKSDQQQTDKSNEILFGEYGTMTGPESTFGLSTHKGIKMAIDEVNHAGGVLGKKIRLISLDDQGKSDEAVTAVTRLVTQEKVHLVLGEVASSRSLAAAPIAQRYKVPMVSPASTNPKVTQIGDYIFRVCFIDPFQGKVMAKFAYENLKLKKAAVFKDIKSDYSIGLAEFFEKEFVRLGGIVAKPHASYVSNDMDFRSQLLAIKKTGAEVLFVPGYYTEVGLIARQAKDVGIKAVLMGGDGWDSPQLVEIGADGIKGAYFSNHYSPKADSKVVKEFASLYRKKYGEDPSGLAAMGYDAARVAINAIKTAQSTDAEKIKNALATTKDFPGVTGQITIDKDRNAVKSAVVLKVSDSGEFDYMTTIKP